MNSEMAYLSNCLYLKKSGTHNLCDAGAMLNQLSYEATQLAASQFCGLMCGLTRTLNKHWFHSSIPSWKQLNILLGSYVKGLDEWSQNKHE